MKGLRIRSRKALSSTVAAIMLIAVTVAVSIVVAAWMGAVTFTSMLPEHEQMSPIKEISFSLFSVNNATHASYTVGRYGQSMLGGERVPFLDAKYVELPLTRAIDCVAWPSENYTVQVTFYKQVCTTKEAGGLNYTYFQFLEVEKETYVLEAQP